MKLSVDIAGLHMRNPVMAASGTFGYGPEYAELVPLDKLGAIVVKGIRETPCDGNPPPRLAETACGLVNAIGLQGPGVEAFIKDYLPPMRAYQVPLIVNVWGADAEEYGRVAARLNEVEGVAGIELNVSCPNVKQGGIAFGTHPKLLAEVVRVTRRNTSLPIITKLSPNVPDISEFARTAEAEGSNAISLINTLPAMVIDIEKRRPVLSNITGGLSGPAIHPVAVKLVWEAARAVSVPVIGMGGITDATTAIEMLIAGASAVAVGTATFTEPNTMLSIIEGIPAYMRRHGFDSIAELTGSITI